MQKLLLYMRCIGRLLGLVSGGGHMPEQRMPLHAFDQATQQFVIRTVMWAKRLAVFHPRMDEVWNLACWIDHQWQNKSLNKRWPVQDCPNTLTGSFTYPVYPASSTPVGDDAVQPHWWKSQVIAHHHVETFPVVARYLGVSKPV